MHFKTKKKILSALLKFRPQELPDLVAIIFHGLEWETIKENCKSLHLNLTLKKDLAKACLNAYVDRKPSVDEVNFSLWYLHFYDAVLHNNSQRKWCGGILIDKSSVQPKSLEDVSDNIQQAYRIDARKVEKIMKIDDDIVFIMVIEKIITKKGIRYGPPFFFTFCVSIDQPYFFYSPVISSGPDHLQYFSQALGHNSYKNINLTGPDVRSLYKKLKIQATNESLQVVPFAPIRFKKRFSLLDFTQGLDRLQYACNVLPPGLNSMKEFTIHAKNEFRGKHPYVDTSAQIKTQMRIKVTGPGSVEDVFRELLALGLMQIPAPDYVTKLQSLQKNSVKLKSLQDSGQGTNGEGTTWDDEF